MGEIINWLRGGDIFIITLVRRNNQENPNKGITTFFPESLLMSSPDFTQWVVKTADEAQNALNQIMNEIVTRIKVAQENEYDIDVEGNGIHVEVNDELTKKTPDCALVVDIMGLGNTDKSNPSKEDHDSIYYRAYITGFRLTANGWE